MLRNKKNQKIKIGIIGAGNIAIQRDIPAVKNNSNFIISSIFDKSLEKAQECSKRFKIPHFTSSLDDFFKYEIDAVLICTPPFTHYELIKHSLLNEKHVLTEKPMVMSAKEGKELEEMAKERKLILMPIHNFLYSRGMTKLKSLIKSDKLGNILGVSGIQWSTYERNLPVWFEKLPGGLFFDEAPHFIYLFQELLGKDLKVKKAYFTKIESTCLENFEIDFECGEKIAHLSFWLGAPISEWLIFVYGNKGFAIFDVFRDICFYLPKERKRTPFYLIEVPLKLNWQLFPIFIKWALSRYLFKRKHFFGTDKIVDLFAKAILEYKIPPISASDGWHVIEIIEQILKETGLLKK